MKFLVSCFYCLTLLLVADARADRIDIPRVTERFTDLTRTLSGDEANRLEGRLKDFETQTSNQIVVLMVPTIGGMPIEEYSLLIAQKNKLGRKGKDNGVLLLIVKDDHKARIEVGYGLEGVLTDALSSQIIRNEMIPHFRENDFFGGIDAGVNAILQVTKGEYTGEPESRNGVRRFSPLVIIIFILLFGVFSNFARRGRRTLLGSRGYYSSGPWFGGFGGGGFGGSGGGGFGGGGGFSGGGGSFGGGGASGSW